MQIHILPLIKVTSLIILPENKEVLGIKQVPTQIITSIIFEIPLIPFL